MASEDEMDRYYVYQFDSETFVVGDDVTNREICICGDYDDLADARQRANRIAELLNGAPQARQVEQQ